MESCSSEFNSLNWAIEIETTHSKRLAAIISSLGDDLALNIKIQSNYQRAEVGVSDLILVPKNVLLDPDFPYECLKYISRVFYIPFCCRDPEWIPLSLNTIFMNSPDDIVLKVICFPKQLEPLLGSLLWESSEGALYPKPKFNLHPSKYSHAIMCVFDPWEGLYKWGIKTKIELEAELMTSESISTELENKRSDSIRDGNTQPVCRAYYKLDEILSVLLPQWHWQIPCGRPGESGIIGIDIGASPGGWSQRLARHCNAVLAVDPGLLRKEILDIPNVFHLPHLVQSEEVTGLLQMIQSESQDVVEIVDPKFLNSKLLRLEREKIRFIVCDINCDARTTVCYLSRFVLPYIEGYGRCCNHHLVAGHSDDLPIISVILVVTLKLFRHPQLRAVKAAAKEVVSRLIADYPSPTCQFCDWRYEWGAVGDELWAGDQDCKMVHLCANSSNERTLVMRRRCFLR